MKILIVPNLLFQYIKLDDIDEEVSKQKMECMGCGFIIGECTVCNIKYFKCGSEWSSSE